MLPAVPTTIPVGDKGILRNMAGIEKDDDHIERLPNAQMTIAESRAEQRSLAGWLACPLSPEWGKNENENKRRKEEEEEANQKMVGWWVWTV